MLQKITDFSILIYWFQIMFIALNRKEPCTTKKKLEGKKGTSKTAFYKT